MACTSRLWQAHFRKELLLYQQADSQNLAMAQVIYKVEAFWDVEAAVWVATSKDVPGLATEAETINEFRPEIYQTSDNTTLP